MYPHVAHVFIDGGHLREAAKLLDRDLLNPRKLASGLIESGPIQTWAYNPAHSVNAILGRVTYYDALPDEGTSTNPALAEYWRAIELLDDVHLGFGALRGLVKRPRQKGVDTLLAVDMVSGAFSGTFDIAVLVAGDADFVPAVEESKRRGVMVALASVANDPADDLRRVVDRFIDVRKDSRWLEVMRDSGKTFPSR